VTQDDGWASLSSVAMTSPGCRGHFHPRGDQRKVAHANHVRCRVWDPMQIKLKKCVAC
jgi:hypothetical protein